MPNANWFSDINALLPGRSTTTGTTRRTALGAALGLGYAAAAAPLMAQTAIHTTAEGLDAGWISFSVQGFEVPAYRAAPRTVPEGQSGLPVVLVVQEILAYTSTLPMSVGAWHGQAIWPLPHSFMRAKATPPVTVKSPS